MCRNHEHPSTTDGARSTANETLAMAHGSLVGGMISKSDSGRTTVATTAPGSVSPSAGTAGHNSAKMGSRRIFTPQFKLQVLDSYRNDGDCKGNQRATARKYGIHRRQIQKWLQVENNLRSVVANGGSGGASSSSGAGSATGSAVHNGSNGGGGSSMKINLLNHHHHLPHHPAHLHHHHHQLHYQQHQHHAPSFHHPGLTSLIQAPSVAATGGLPAHYHHHMQQHQLAGPQHPLAAFHPIVPSHPQTAAQPSIDLKVAGLVESARHRVARNGASVCMMSPVLTHTSAATPTAAIPVSSCSPLSIASSSGASLSSSSVCSSSPSSSLRRSPSTSLSSQHHLIDPAPATSAGDAGNHRPPQQAGVIFSPVPLLAAATSEQHQQQQQYYNYYGHIRAVAAAAAQAAAVAAAAAANVVHRRYDHPIDLSRPDRTHSAVSSEQNERRHDPEHLSIASDHDEDDGGDEEISVDGPESSHATSSSCTSQGMMTGVEQAWDLSCRRSSSAITITTTTVSSDRKRSSSEMSGSISTAPETSRPPKSVKLFKPYLLGEEEKKDEHDDDDVRTDEHDGRESVGSKRRRDSALADEDKDSTRESPAISDHPASSPGAGKHQQVQQHQYPVIWSNTNNNSSSYYENFYEFSPPAHPLVPLLQPPQQSSVPEAGATVRVWNSPQASPVSGYDSSTSISSVYSGPEEDSSSSRGDGGDRPEQLKQQAIDSFYHDVACRGDYRAVASKYNINRKYVEKWLQQKQEDDHHHASSVPLANVRAPLVVG